MVQARIVSLDIEIGAHGSGLGLIRSVQSALARHGVLIPSRSIRTRAELRPFGPVGVLWPKAKPIGDRHKLKQFLAVNSGIRPSWRFNRHHQFVD
jgi:hypothetical protein